MNCSISNLQNCESIKGLRNSFLIPWIFDFFYISNQFICLYLQFVLLYTVCLSFLCNSVIITFACLSDIPIYNSESKMNVPSVLLLYFSVYIQQKHSFSAIRIFALSVSGTPSLTSSIQKLYNNTIIWIYCLYVWSKGELWVDWQYR